MSTVWSADGLLSCVQEAYSLPLIELMKAASGAQVKWMLTDSKGQRYFLKEKPYYLQRDEFLSTLPFYQQLLEQGIVAPEVCMTRSGDLYLEQAWRQFVLLRYLPGEGLDVRQDPELEELGRLSARLHAISWGKSGLWEAPDCRLLHFPDVRPEGTVRMWELLRSYGEQEPALLHLIEQLQGEFDRLEKRVAWEELPTAWLHGDLHHFNVLKQPNGESALLDLDDWHWGYRLSDLTWTIVVSSAWDWSDVGSHPVMRESLQEMAVQRILQGYEQVHSLTEAERNALPYFFAVLLIKSLICMESLIRNRFGHQAADVLQFLTAINRLRKE